MLTSITTEFGTVDVNEILENIETLITEKRKQDIMGRMNTMTLPELKLLQDEVRLLNSGSKLKNGFHKEPTTKKKRRGRPKMSKEEHLLK